MDNVMLKLEKQTVRKLREIADAKHWTMKYLATTLIEREYAATFPATVNTEQTAAQPQ